LTAYYSSANLLLIDSSFQGRRLGTKVKERPLPSWAQEPLTMDEAARALGVCRRTLAGLLRDYRYFEARGARKVFYPEHISALREAFQRRSRASSEARRGGAAAKLSEELLCERVMAGLNEQKAKT
jgi:hypothetical protein